MNAYFKFFSNWFSLIYRFPKDPILRKKWIIATKRKNFDPSKSAVLCSRHFLVEDFVIYTGKRLLEKEAIPSIFDFPEHLRKKIIPRRKLIRKGAVLPRWGLIHTYSTYDHENTIIIVYIPGVFHWHWSLRIYLTLEISFLLIQSPQHLFKSTAKLQ